LQTRLGAGKRDTFTILVGCLPKFLIVVEISREAATITMLIAVAMFAVRSLRERWALVLWMFAFCAGFRTPAG
jgi:hypothetical protein